MLCCTQLKCKIKPNEFINLNRENTRHDSTNDIGVDNQAEPHRHKHKSNSQKYYTTQPPLALRRALLKTELSYNLQPISVKKRKNNLYQLYSYTI